MIDDDKRFREQHDADLRERHDLAGRDAFKVGLVERVDGRAEAIAPRPRQARSGRPRADIDAANRWRAYTSGWRVGARSGAPDPKATGHADRGIAEAYQAGYNAGHQAFNRQPTQVSFFER